MTQVVVCGGGRAGRGGATGSSQCWSVGQPVHSSLLPTMASVVIVLGLDSFFLSNIF
jgi:hypothetical protein